MVSSHNAVNMHAHHVQGRYDGAGRIVHILRERVGVDGFHFTVEVRLRAV